MAKLRTWSVLFLFMLTLAIGCGVRDQGELIQDEGRSGLFNETNQASQKEGTAPVTLPLEADLNGDGRPDFRLGDACKGGITSESVKISCPKTQGLACKETCKSQTPPLEWTGYWRGEGVENPAFCECIGTQGQIPKEPGFEGGSLPDTTLDPKEPRNVTVTDPFSDPGQAHGADRPKPKPPSFGGPSIGGGGWR